MPEPTEEFRKAAEEIAANFAEHKLNLQQQRLVTLERELVSAVRAWAAASVTLDDARHYAADPRGVYPAAQANRDAEGKVQSTLNQLCILTKEFVRGGEMFPNEVGT